jgi:AraC-like DNA-binding protein
MRIIVFTYLLFTSAFLCGQDLDQHYLNSLEYEELLTIFNEYDRDSTNQELIARTYLDRARKEKDTIKMARGYDRLARIFHPEKNITYADSVISLTKDQKHITYPALGYILKGFYYALNNKLQLSTENYLLALDFSNNSENLQQQVYILDMLINLKATWGNKKEALELQRKRHKIILKDNYIQSIEKATRTGASIDIDQLFAIEKVNSYESFIYCFIQLKQTDSAKKYIYKTKPILKQLSGVEKDYHLSWVLESEMEVTYLGKEYIQTLKKADNILNMYYNSLTPNSLLNVYLHKGLSLIKLNRLEEGINWIKKSDSIYNSSYVVINYDDRKIFEILFNYYEKKENTLKQIEYLNKLISIDSLFKKNFQYFDPEMIKKYETPELIAEKEELIAGLTVENQRSRRANWWIATGLILTLGLSLFYFNLQRRYKNRFRALLEAEVKGDIELTAAPVVKNEISTEVVDSILKHLDAFESEKGYLSTDLSLQSLAKNFETNSNYLSRVINLKMEKNFSKYINDLRVKYAVKELRTNSIFRKFTIKAIAQESGFSSTESFRRAFFSRNKIYPSFYIKSLEKTKN